MSSWSNLCLSLFNLHPLHPLHPGVGCYGCYLKIAVKNNEAPRLSAHGHVQSFHLDGLALKTQRALSKQWGFEPDWGPVVQF